MATKALSIETLLGTWAGSENMFMTEVDIDDSPEALVVNIPLLARIATDREGRWELSQSSNPRWRWAAGGALPIICLRDVTITPLQVSDPTLPKWANHLTAATGISASPEEWVRPRTLIREAFEEVCIATPTGLVVPQFGDFELDALSFGALPMVLRLIENAQHINDLFTTDMFNLVRATMVPLKGEKDVTVQVGGRECSRTRALPVIDPTTRGIDLMHAFELDLRTYSLAEISVFLAEDKDGKPVDAEMACLELGPDRSPRSIIRSFQGGQAVKGRADLEKLSPVLRQTLAAL